MMNKELIKLGIASITLLLLLLVAYAMVNNDTPRPNQEHFDKIKEHYGYIGCEHIYIEACNKYKEDKNLTFDCFE